MTEEQRIKNLAAVHRYQDRNREKVKETWRNYYRKRYNKWVEFLTNLGYDTCSKCGYNKCFAALDFHHRSNDRINKHFTISQMMSKTFSEVNKQKVLEEIKKCDVLCANCHRELHHLGE
jgi:hypothetical protein